MRLSMRFFAFWLAAIVACGATASVWETAETPVPGLEVAESHPQDDAPIAIQAVGRFVYATVSRPVTVRVFTILGQQVSQETLKPGVYRLNLPARGIYILRAGSITRRITL